MEFEGKTKVFYEKCLSDLKQRGTWTESWVPMLEQYVFKVSEADKLMEEIQSESVEVEHTNKASHTNKVTSPKWRMFLDLTKAAASLAKELQLTPLSVKDRDSKMPVKKEKALEGKMRKLA